MINLWAYFHTLNFWMVPLALGLLTSGFIIPFHSLMSLTGPRRRWPFHFFVLVNPVIEEVLFRLLLLGFLSQMFDFTIAVMIMSVIYSLYMGILYGSPSMADGLILGVLLSFAMLEFGFAVVLMAHIVYRLIYAMW